MSSEIAAIYRASKKKQDINWFTEWIARPPAAVVVYALRNTPITPNQITFLSALVAAAACALIVLLPGWTWLVVACLVFEFSFVLDCADGQLARLRKIASPVGHLLDFLRHSPLFQHGLAQLRVIPALKIAFDADGRFVEVGQSHCR